MTPKLRWKDLRQQWLAQVAKDPSIRDFAFKVAYVLADRVDRKTHEIWPSAVNLAAKLGLKKAGVEAGIELLVINGHLEQLDSGRAFKVYRPVVLPVREDAQ